MSGPEAAQGGQHESAAGLLGKLMAAVRPQFRADELVFDQEGPVFGGKLCLVTGCGRAARGQGLCHGHQQRWAAAGRPDVAGFAAATDPRWRKNAPLSSCGAPGCRYGVTRRKGLCGRHAGAWERAGMPDLQSWLDALPDTAPAVPPADCLAGILRAAGRARERLVPVARQDLGTARTPGCCGVRCPVDGRGGNPRS